MAKKKEKLTDIHSIKECPDCASQNLVYNDDSQQVICRDCGLIYEPLAPEGEKRFEASHAAAPAERIMIKAAEEKPKRARKKAAKKARKAAKKKQARKKPAKKAAKKHAKKKAAKKAPKPAKKKGIFGHIRARLKGKR